MITYKGELAKAMKWLAGDQRTVFLGQSVKFPGTGMYGTLEGIPDKKKIELPVFEDIQMGMTIGMSLQGLRPVSIFPRMDFLLLALNQLVNHADKMSEMSDGQFTLGGMIIRTAIGSTNPLMPGPQHCQDHTQALFNMLPHIWVVTLDEPGKILTEYKEAFRCGRPTVIIENPDLYNE